MRGGKPKPTALKRLEGNPGRRPLAENELSFAPAPAKATPPAALGSAGRAKWQELYPLLRNTGILTVADLGTLETYCELWQQFCVLRRRLRSIGETVDASGQLDSADLGPFRALTQLAIALRNQAGELGISPASRTRMSPAPWSKEPSPPQSDEVNEAPAGPPKVARQLGRIPIAGNA